MTPEEITLSVCPRNGRSTRSVQATWQDQFYRDRLDTDDAESRRKFFGVVGERTGIARADLVQVHDIAMIRMADEADLKADEAAKAEAEKQAASEQRRSPEELLAATPDDIKAEARALLESPDLIDAVIEDIQRLGVAGEKKLSGTVYLTGVSRLLPQPLAVRVQGPSSSGKSYVIKKAASLFPPEAVIVATSLTPQSLYYMDRGSLVHRFVVAGERRRAEDDETADATRALREMLSEGKLSILVPVKADGRQRTIPVEQEGPIAYVESTSLTRIFDEDANRSILVNTDERPEQTRRILTATAAAYCGGVPVDTQRIILKHHALQRMLEEREVVVPYADRLADAITDKRVEARRAFPHVLSMIQASALLHQRQRQLDPEGRLIADADDYWLARRLLAGPMARQLGGGISDPAARFLERLRGWFDADETFTASDAIQRENGSKSAVYGWLDELRAAGFTEQVEAHRGNQAAKWQLSGDAPDPDASAVLPSVEEVCPDS